MIGVRSVLQDWHPDFPSLCDEQDGDHRLDNHVLRDEGKLPETLESSHGFLVGS